MSKYQGGMIGSVANTPSGTAYTGKANGIWSLPHHIAAKSALLWAIGQTKPNPPTIGTATGVSSTSISVAFIPPVQDGGSTITVYTVTSSPGNITAIGTSSPIVVTGLTTGTNYTFTVTATNSLGTSVSSSASNSTLPIVGDPYFSSVALLMHCDNTLGDPNWSNVSLLITGDDLLDKSTSNNTVTINGTTNVNTSIKKYGTGSLFHAAGSTNYLSIPGSCINFGTGDFTIEFWGYTTNIGAESLGMAGNIASSSFMIMCGGNGSGRISFGVTSASWNLNSATSAIATNTWYHIAVTRTGTTARLFINGTVVDTQTLSTNFINATAFEIGRRETSYGATYDCYYDDIRITKGVCRYTTSFTPSVNLVGAGTAPLDNSNTANTLTTVGNIQANTTYAKFGAASLYFDGSSFIRIPSGSPGYFTGDFTIECWVYPLAKSSNYDALFTLSANASASNGWNYNNSNTTMEGFVVSIGCISYGASVIPTYTSSVPLNQWSHVACVRVSGIISVYINGTSVLSGVNYGNTLGTSNNNTPAIGVFDYYGSAYRYFYNGYIDDFRITNGVARYTAAFTPPTSAFPNIAESQLTDSNFSSVALLLNGDGVNGSQTFTDLSSSPKTVTNIGTVTVDTTIKKFGTGSISLSAGKGLTVPQSVFNFGTTTDFTIEFWVYLNTRTSFSTICGQWGTNTTFNIMLNNASTVGIQYMPGNLYASGSANTSIPLQTWTHVAFCRSGSTCKSYINGVGTALSSNPNISPTGAVGVGNVSDQFTYGIDGYIDDFRVTSGIARYTTDFTPPTAALPTS